MGGWRWRESDCVVMGEPDEDNPFKVSTMLMRPGK
jgi:hypothetical protein